VNLPTADRQNAALDALVELQRADARSFARQSRTLVELDRLSRLEGVLSGGPQFLVLELAGSLRLGQQAAGASLVDADRLVHGLPRVLTALEEGRMFVPQVRIVLAETRAWDEDMLRRLDAVLMPEAQELASSDLRRLVRRAVLEHELPDEAAERLERARASRHVTSRPGLDGMAVLTALLTAEQLARFQVDLGRLEARERIAGPRGRHRPHDRPAAGRPAGCAARDGAGRQLRAW
jgi:hypothetical protein